MNDVFVLSLAFISNSKPYVGILIKNKKFNVDLLLSKKIIINVDLELKITPTSLT